jgi:hypothetical protein
MRRLTSLVALLVYAPSLQVGNGAQARQNLTAINGPVAPAGSYRIKALFDASDAVCVGTVEGVRDAAAAVAAQPSGSATPPVTKTFGLSAARCYKGAIEPTQAIEFTTHEPQVSFYDMELPNGDYALYFLKKSDAGKFTFADQIWGRLTDASLVLLPPAEGSGLAQLESDILFNLRTLHEPAALSRELRFLQGFDRVAPATVAAVRPYAKDVDRRVALAAFSVLARAGAPDDLAALCQYAQGPEDPVFDALAVHSGFNLGELRNPGARLALECLARTPVPLFKLTAMVAIRAIKSPASVPELIRRLDDPDKNTQFLAYITLWEIVRRKDDPGEGAGGFAAKRDVLVASWKQWWNETGRLQYPER